MKFFVVILPLLFTLSTAQDASPEAATEAANNIVSYIRPLLGLGKPEAFDTILDDSFVFKHCDYGTFGKEKVVKLISSLLGFAADVELNNAYFYEDQLQFHVNIFLGDTLYVVYFIAKPSELNETGYAVVSGQTITCG